MNEDRVYWPVALDVKRIASTGCLIVGGGGEAEFKSEVLVGFGVVPRLVSLEWTAGLEEMAVAGHVVLQRQAYEPGVIAGAGLVIAATDDDELNSRIAADARSSGAMVNVVDDADKSDFITMALARAGDITVAVSTGGRSPAFASVLRDRIRALLCSGYVGYLAYFVAVRELVTEVTINFRQRVQIWRDLREASLLDVLEDDGAAAAGRIVKAVVSNYVEVSETALAKLPDEIQKDEPLTR